MKPTLSTTEIADDAMDILDDDEIRRSVGIFADTTWDDDLESMFNAATSYVASILNKPVNKVNRVDWFYCWGDRMTLAVERFAREPFADNSITGLTVNYFDFDNNEQVFNDYIMDETVEIPTLCLTTQSRPRLSDSFANPIKVSYKHDPMASLGVPDGVRQAIGLVMRDVFQTKTVSGDVGAILPRITREAANRLLNPYVAVSL